MDNQTDNQNSSNPTEAPAEIQIQLVVFRLDNEEYCCELTELKEIIRLTEITPVPNAPEYVKGIINLRGKIVVIVDLEKKFQLIHQSSNQPEHIIVIASNNSLFGVIVDKVTEVLRISKQKINPAHNLTNLKINQEFLKGVVILNEKNAENKEDNNSQPIDPNSKSRLIIMLDIKKLLETDHLEKLVISNNNPTI
ncbi:MAG: chemotaxis protein CheW [bacterium]